MQAVPAMEERAANGDDVDVTFPASTHNQAAHSPPTNEHPQNQANDEDNEPEAAEFGQESPGFRWSDHSEQVYVQSVKLCRNGYATRPLTCRQDKKWGVCCTLCKQLHRHLFCLGHCHIAFENEPTRAL